MSDTISGGQLPDELTSGKALATIGLTEAGL